MSDFAIKVEGLGKKYLIKHQAESRRYVALRDVLADRVKSLFHNRKSEARNQKSVEEFWALKDVSFEVKPGEVVGIIGRNGAGKSTLLKLLSRITEPAAGRIRLRGRVASLLEVGTGFHPELTGRENIFLNGAVLGMHRAEIRKKFDEIVAFAEVEKFLDTPVKRYSSGMYMRLAFAVAAHLEPEILIVDEVLAVGDAQFQKKCLGKMQDVSAREGRTVLFVSHNMTAVQSLCSRGILMKDGRVSIVGDIEDCIRKYLMVAADSQTVVKWPNALLAPGTDKVRIRSVQAVSKRTDGEDPFLFDMATPIDVEIEYEVLHKSQFHFTLVFNSGQGVIAFTSGCARAAGWRECPEPGRYKIVCHIPAHLLNEGRYDVRVMIIEDGTRAAVDLNDLVGFEVKDLLRREIGSWHDREPGPVRPLLDWEFVIN